jgi:hypothetical protein
LLLFGLVGLLAVVMCYLIEPKGRASLGMTRGLLTVMGAEGLTVILLIVEAESRQQRVIAAELYVLTLLACAWVTFLHEKSWLPGGGSDEPRLRALRRGFYAVLVRTLIGTSFFALLAVSIWGLDAEVVILYLATWGLAPTAWLALELREAGRPPRGGIEPFQVPFTRDGMTLIIAAIAASVVLPAAVFGNLWLLISLAASASLVAGLWRAAVMPKRSFLWYGVAVFVSVPLFGTLTWMVQNVFEPQVQPMAMIRKHDGAYEYLQGLYMTETGGRVYFATVASEGCSKDLVSGSGRLLSVPKSEVAAIAIGPLQNVTRARRAAQEMAYALAPSAEIPAKRKPELTASGQRVRSVQAHDHVKIRRLEDVHAAIEPTFGAGVRLVPEVAAPGQIVTLKMSAPKEATRGFGRSRHHRTLRLDGIPVDLAQERARSPWEAEYIETSDGRKLKLGKQIAYTRSDGVYEAVSRHDSVEGRRLFVRISDRSVIGVYDDGLTSRGYLKLDWPRHRPVRLATTGDPPEVMLRGGTLVPLKTRLLRQAWHEDHIRFRVPKGARAGKVTIDCGQIGGEPLLRVDRSPLR